MSTMSEIAETLTHPSLNQNDTSSHLVPRRHVHVRNRKQGRLTPIEPDDSGTPVNEDGGTPVNEDNGTPVAEDSGTPVNKDSGNSVHEGRGVEDSGTEDSGNGASGTSVNEDGGNEDSGTSVNEDGGNEDSGNEDRGSSVNEDSGNEDSGVEDSGTSVNEDSGNEDSGNEDSGNEDSGNEDSGNEDSGNEDSGNEDSGNEDSGNQDSGNEDSGNEDSGNEDSGSSVKEDGGNEDGGDKGSGTSVNKDCGTPVNEDKPININDQKRQPQPIPKDKPAAMRKLRHTKLRQQVQPKRRMVQSSAFDGDETKRQHIYAILLKVNRYLYDILGQSFQLVRWPLSLLIGLLILAVVLSILTTMVKDWFCSTPVLSLFCWFSGPQVVASWKCFLPGSSRVFPECRPPGVPQGTQEVQRILYVHDELNNVQDTVVSQLSLPYLIKRSETAIREVSKRVELSDLPSKSRLAPLFVDFWKQAHETGRNIDKFFLRVRYTHDSAIGIMMKTERHLEHIQELEEQERTQPIISRVLSLLQPEPPLPFVLIREQYLAHLDRLKGHLDKLIVENKLVLDSLENLNRNLFTMGDYIAEDNQKLHDSQLSLQTGLNRIRPNRPAFQKIESSLATLDELSHARKYGVAVFDASLVRLQRTSAELNDLRERFVKEDVLVEEATEIASLNSQIFMVRKALTRMQESKLKAEKGTEKFREDLYKQLDESYTF